METVGNILLEKEILLESGTNELEVLVFKVADCTFGINVAKVREVLPKAEIVQLPRAHRSIRGVFRLRDRVIPCVSLVDHLELGECEAPRESLMILADFNRQQTAFLVDQVERIHRLSWKQIMAVTGLVAMSKAPVTAVARVDGRLVLMLDFETILDGVTDQYFRTEAVANPRSLPRESLKLLLADDSPTVRQAIAKTLTASGYTNVHYCENGSEAWQWLENAMAESPDVPCQLVISDVEMPQVDGFHLTKRIKDHPRLKGVPVLLYSSIVTPDNLKKGQAVGADAQVAKPDLSKVVELADELIDKCRTESKIAVGPAPVTLVPAMAAIVTPSAKPAAVPTPAGPPLAEGNEPGLPRAVALTDLPEGVDPELWPTFRDELTRRVKEFRNQSAQLSDEAHDQAALNAVMRTLHTVKSAAMVLPLDAVSHVTHLMEGLAGAIQGSKAEWPADEFEQYVSWLDELATLDARPRQVLRRAGQIEATLRGAQAK